jgi:hypothetical protein
MRQRQSLAPVILWMLGLDLLLCVWGIGRTGAQWGGFIVIVEFPLLLAATGGGLLVLLALGERMRNHRVLLTAAAFGVGLAAAYGMAVLLMHTVAGGSVSGAGAGIDVLPAAAGGLGRSLVDDHRGRGQRRLQLLPVAFLGQLWELPARQRRDPVPLRRDLDRPTVLRTAEQLDVDLQPCVLRHGPASCSRSRGPAPRSTGSGDPLH